MPPKGSRGGTSKKAKVAEPAEPKAVDSVPAGNNNKDNKDVLQIIELHPGEKDNTNLAYIEKLAQAWSCIEHHDVFRGIQAATPAQITTDANQSGTQAPFDLKDYHAALQTAAQSYTAGINLFWVNLQWSATPGVPLRVAAIENLAQTTFRQPVSIGTVHVAVTGPQYNPLEHKGALLRVSPEELTGAYVLAIARDIRNNEPNEVLLAWKQYVLSTTCVFKVLPLSTDRYWYALNQRELFSVTHKAVHRSTLQRLHEISRLMKRMKDSVPHSEVTAAAIAKAYAENLHMTPGSSSMVTLNFVDCCATITRKLLDVPAIAWCLQDLDERSALSEEPNPFDSHSRLQAIIDKCRANNQVQLVWVIQGIWYHWRRGNIKYLSVTDIKGTAASGNRGVADLLLFKLHLKNALLHKAKALFPESADWFGITVAGVAESFKSWFENEAAVDKAWRAGRPPSETKCLNFFSEVVFGRAYDGPVKVAVKAGKAADEALLMPGLVESLQEIETKRAAEQQLPASEEAHDEQTDKNPRPLEDIVFRLPPSAGSDQPTLVRASMVQDQAKRDMLDDIINSTRQTIAAHIHLLPQEPSEPHNHGLLGAVMGTPLGKLRGSPDLDTPIKSKYIGVFYDPKVAGEANHRPMQRIPPLRSEPMRRLLDVALNRFGPDEIPEGDLYFLFDGGRSGNQGDLLKPFHGKPKSVKTFLLWRDEASLMQRLQRVKGGVGSCRQTEQLHVVSALAPAVVPAKFQNFHGSSAGTMMGPIVLPQASTCWQATWPQKKEIFTAANLIPVGGRLEDEDDAEAQSTPKAKPRDKDTVEPVFFHALPGSFYSELLTAFPLMAVLDLTPGDGALALTAYKRGLVYVGLVFSETHKAMLMEHLERTIWQCMSDDADPLYEPRLVAALVDDKTTATAEPKAKAKGKAKGKATAKPASKPTAKRPRDPDDAAEDSAGEGNHGEGDEGDVLSGDNVEE